MGRAVGELHIVVYEFQGQYPSRQTSDLPGLSGIQCPIPQTDFDEDPKVGVILNKAFNLHGLSGIQCPILQTDFDEDPKVEVSDF